MEDFESHSSDFDDGSTQVDVEEGAPAWTTTFGDMMSLLLTFFILLFSMSEVKMDRFMLASQSMREAMGGTAVEAIEDPQGLMPDPVDPELQMQNPSESEDTADDPAAEDLSEASAEDRNAAPDDGMAERLAEAYLEDITRRLEEFIDENDLHEVLRVDRDEDGVYLRIKASALFPSGEAQIAESSRWILTHVSELTASIEVGVVVGGHADNIPIRSPAFPSNWELSAARAAGVARELVAGGHDPTEIRVESYGEYRPLFDNATPEGRAGNRRVELFYSWSDVLSMTRAWSRGLKRAGS